MQSKRSYIIAVVTCCFVLGFFEFLLDEKYIKDAWSAYELTFVNRTVSQQKSVQDLAQNLLQEDSFHSITDSSVDNGHQEGVSIHNVSEQTSQTTQNNVPQLSKSRRDMKFYILPVPEITSWLIGNYTERSYQFYENALNELTGEIWIHRVLEQNMTQEQRTDDPSEADVIIICGYLHLNEFLVKKTKRKEQQTNDGSVPFLNQDWVQLVKNRMIPNKPHIIAVPTMNPTTGNQIGLSILSKEILRSNSHVDLLSFGYERNDYWQKIPPERIIPIPYVVSPHYTREELAQQIQRTDRSPNYVFYVGDYRKHAVEWAGCNRSMVLPLQERTDMFVRLVSKAERLSQEEYNDNMGISEYCLVLCGDTPSSRSLASSIVNGCIPIRVGSRLRGLCESPCHKGWGWTTANLTHLPFTNKIDWGLFPEVDEARFVNNPGAVLDDLFTKVTDVHKTSIRSIMQQTQLGWVYGWGHPMNSTDFGQAVPYALDSLFEYLWKRETL